jgi:uncharacterized membrane protein
MPKKFDTNPLDPEFPEKAKAATQTANQSGYTAPQKSAFSTSEFPQRPPSVTEEETRRFGEEEFSAYSFQGASPPAAYQPPPYTGDMNRASDRKVASTGVAEKWLVGLPYLPFHIGLVAGLVLLLVIPKEENKVRFHAAQGFSAQVAILIVSAGLGVVGNIADSNFGSSIFFLVTTIMMIIWAIKAWKGKPVHIEVIDDLTNWFEDKIGPVKS